MNWLASKTGFWFNDLLKGYSVGKNFRTFLNQLQLEQDEIQEIQLNKFQKLISYAWEKSSFYKTRLKSIGAEPGDFTDPLKIKSIPALTREDLQHHWKEIIPSGIDINSLNKGSSSGSTGVPVVYYKNSDSSSAGQAAGYVCWSLGGWKLGMKGLHIWGNPTTVKNEWSRLSSKMKARFLSHYKFPAYQLTEPDKIRELADLIEKEKFEFIDGYTNSIYILADYVKQNQGALKHKLNMVFTTAENLHDYQRQTINETLGPVFDLYGCSEINGIAGECATCGKYHVMDTHVIVEYGKVMDEFENRELIITDLDNYAFPLIRYQNNDLGKSYSGSQSCTIPFSRMEQVSGRQSDIIILPDGGTLSVPSFFGSMLLKKINGIVKYQIEKDRPDHLLLKFVVGKTFSDKDKETIGNSMKDYLGDRIKWDIAIVDDIPVSATGKFKLVIDKTKQDA